MTLWHQALPASLHENLYRELENALAWRQPVVRVFGRDHLTPRLTTWEGEQGVSYRYSGLTETAAGWPLVLRPVLEQVEAVTGHRFNSVLGNLYRDGSDSMGYHSDDETELGPQPWIASLSLGASRDFVFRRRSGSRHQCASISLEDNTLLLMSPGVQAHFQHALPRRARVTEGRINLTFRYIVSPRTDS
ncbi:alpha-ketoglutarate-dependent dioxygenase AlkB [Alcanivorax sp. DP30]|uniref:alpha-ketoglutarate-dependent dioxygenase AlkB family protein n=1 Tax=Alcanivorax sp. DP30 TaxID=2606217 RepID=UPI001F20C6A6|nr:alpha-ketoglutarate-dependent dioxygenase AlkB [Alcanivorax sp. DP30]